MMYSKKIIYCLLTSSIFYDATGISNSITYQDPGAFSKDAPGYNFPDNDPRFKNVKPIMFTPYEDVVTGDDSNKNQYGYFWNIQDTDNDQQFTGKARIGNSQYIDVVAADAQKISSIGDEYDIAYTDQRDIYHTSQYQKNRFNPQYLVKIGTFMKKNDPTVYVLFGRYYATIMPDPQETEIT